MHTANTHMGVKEAQVNRVLRTLFVAGTVFLFPMLANASPVLHMMVGELTGCATYGEVAKVFGEVSAEAAKNGTMQGSAWRPLHHSGASNTVFFAFLSPGLEEYGAQMDRLFGSTRSAADRRVAKRMYDCVRVTQRSADLILAGPTTVSENVRIADRSVFRLNGQCSDADMVSFMGRYNAWATARGYPQRGIRRPLYGPQADTLVSYGLYPSMAAYTEVTTKMRVASTNPGSEMAQLMADVSKCGTLLSRISSQRLQ